MAENDAQQTSEALAVVLHELAQRTERLKQLYEQYFMGIERMEPLVARKEVTRTMLLLQQQYIRNTALRFKFNSMLQKWNIYLTYWTRTLREIENGTYTKHLRKAARNAEKKGVDLPTELRVRGAGAQIDERADSVAAENPSSVADEAANAIDRLMGSPSPPSAKAPPPMAKAPPLPAGAKPPPPLPAGAKAPPALPGARPAAPPLPVAGAKPVAPPPPGARGQLPPTTPASTTRNTPPHGVPVRAPTPSEGVTIRTTPAQGVPISGTPPQGARVPANVPGMSEADLRTLHKRYADARAASGDATPVKYETLVASLAKQVPKVLEQPGVRGVRFDVAIKDGKPILKAIPTK